MRTTIQPQLSLVQPHFEHDHTKELQAISLVLDEEPKIAEMIFADLAGHEGRIDTGRKGMTAEQVIRAIIIKQMNQYSYEELAFHLTDSRSYRSFCRFGIGDRTPTKATLQRNIKRVSTKTMEAINQIIIQRAQREGIERGKKIRVDCTVMETNIHDPTDSWLLWDCVRVMTRSLHRTKDLTDFCFTDHTRRAKRRYIAIRNVRGEKKRLKLYKDLLKVTKKTQAAAHRAIEALDAYEPADPKLWMMAEGLILGLKEILGKTCKIIGQTERRLLNGRVRAIK